MGIVVYLRLSSCKSVSSHVCHKVLEFGLSRHPGACVFLVQNVVSQGSGSHSGLACGRCML